MNGAIWATRHPLVLGEAVTGTSKSVILALQKKKKKEYLSKSEDLIGFIKRLMNQGASHLANRELLQGVTHYESLL